MRSFIVKHPLLTIHVVGLITGFAGAAAGLSMRGIVVLGFAVGIPYALLTWRLDEAAARERRAQQWVYPPPGRSARAIHPD